MFEYGRPSTHAQNIENETITERYGRLLEEKQKELNRSIELLKNNTHGRATATLKVSELVEAFGENDMERLKVTLDYLERYNVLIIK
jgi:hypothetical protein